MKEQFIVIKRVGFACPWCDRAIQLLTDNGHDFQVHHWTREQILGAGYQTVPQIFHGEKHIGGYSDLVEYQTQLAGA